MVEIEPDAVSLVVHDISGAVPCTHYYLVRPVALGDQEGRGEVDKREREREGEGEMRGKMRE